MDTTTILPAGQAPAAPLPPTRPTCQTAPHTVTIDLPDAPVTPEEKRAAFLSREAFLDELVRTKRENWNFTNADFDRLLRQYDRDHPRRRRRRASR